ncbi:MAG: hypothetical protein ACK5OS_02475 [Chryseotalea sp.]|jgi:hypothetical protein
MSGPVDIEFKNREREQKDRMIKKMLWLGYQMGYDIPESEGEKRMDRKRVNYNHVERWCRSEKCCIRKTLKGYTVDELSKVLSQFDLVYQSFKKTYGKKVD